ncbi:unnamed protein product [marine sediment metagenome]|uniref:Uncharacterized protein n=1 Tax=marine sediment metagenome TaxID=412755 RepID=X1SUD0_9ZZZZ
MRKISVVLLAALLLIVAGALPSFSEVEITEEMMKEAKPADEETIKIEIAKEQEETRPWEKYLYLDVDQNLNEDSQTFWTRVGTRKGSFDFSVGWTQKFNEPETQPTDKGMASMSISYWW